ncbi:hypothetical protein K2Z83_17415 [Oscillochloris sp. ZM17-4]|uniref:WD40/YVTN/BNR-like repeat-containing protein n=1 Tax=Oscillochloris sp. ZM17-4 TaxID=2866714 RepID=UPI001C72BD6E|nr:hypothetical protein [Oscillochloris sp. ZM17-4]MBX0329453.1 hypothetical protein [Oscillochloris sp. ZM17-4]
MKKGSIMRYAVICLFCCVLALISCVKPAEVSNNDTITPTTIPASLVRETPFAPTSTRPVDNNINNERYCYDIPWNGFTALAFITQQKGWIVSRDQLMQTKDGGRTWSVISKLPIIAISLDFVNDDDGMLQDTCGNVFITHTAGKSWGKILFHNPNIYVISSDYVNVLHGYILSEEGLYSTSDRGLSWQTVQTPCSSPISHQSISFPTVDVGWLLCVGEPSAGSQGKVLWRTVDGGKSWTEQATTEGGESTQNGFLPFQGYGHQLFFLDSSIGWIGMGRAEVGGLYATKDSGNTWALVNSTTISEVSHVTFFDEQNGVSLSNPDDLDREVVVLLATHDGGKTWEP